MGRPQKPEGLTRQGKKLFILLTEEQMIFLDAESERTYNSKANIMRKLLAEYIKKSEMEE